MPSDLEYFDLIDPECQIIAVKVSPSINEIVAAAQLRYIILLVAVAHDTKIGLTKAGTKSKLVVHFWYQYMSAVWSKHDSIINEGRLLNGLAIDQK